MWPCVFFLRQVTSLGLHIGNSPLAGAVQTTWFNGRWQPQQRDQRGQKKHGQEIPWGSCVETSVNSTLRFWWRFFLGASGGGAWWPKWSKGIHEGCFLIWWISMSAIRCACLNSLNMYMFGYLWTSSLLTQDIWWYMKGSRVQIKMDKMGNAGKVTYVLNMYSSWTPTAARPWHEVAFFAFGTYLKGWGGVGHVNVPCHLHTCWMLRYWRVGVGWGMLTFLVICTHVGCYVTEGLGWGGGMLTFLVICTHVGCYVTEGLGWGGAC